MSDPRDGLPPIPGRFTLTVGRPPILDAEAARARAVRARELLDGAGWVFDELISDQNRQLLDTAPAEVDQREEHYRMIRASAELKAHLIRIVENQVAKERLDEYRARNERPADHE